jgi:hypothetical protein
MCSSEKREMRAQLPPLPQHGVVAQMVERSPEEGSVTGSIPVYTTK